MDTLSKKVYNIEEITELVVGANTSLIKKAIFEKEKEILEKENINILKIEENNQLKGICIYHDSGDLRTIEELCYIGKNTYIFLRFIKFIAKGNDWKYLRLITSKYNDRLNKFYFKLGFIVVDKIESILLLMYKRKKWDQQQQSQE